MVTHEGGTIPEENLTNYNADRVKTLGEAVLGPDAGLRPVPRPQVRSDHAEGLLPDVRVLQFAERQGARWQRRRQPGAVRHGEDRASHRARFRVAKADRVVEGASWRGSIPRSRNHGSGASRRNCEARGIGLKVHPGSGPQGVARRIAGRLRIGRRERRPPDAGGGSGRLRCLAPGCRRSTSRSPDCA